MTREEIFEYGIIELMHDYKREYKKNLALLTKPLNLNSEPIDANYYKLMEFYRGADILDIEGKDKAEAVSKLIDIIESKKASGISVGYIMPHILYVLDLLDEIYDDMMKDDINSMTKLDCE